MCSGFIDLREVVNIVKRDGKFKIPKIVILWFQKISPSKK
jgi:hypothetical protein